MILNNEVFIIYDDVKNECIASFFTCEDYRIDNNVSIKGKYSFVDAMLQYICKKYNNGIPCKVEYRENYGCSLRKTAKFDLNKVVKLWNEKKELKN